MRDWNGPIIDGGDLYGEYILREVRLRLGDKLKGATKHLIDGQGYVRIYNRKNLIWKL